MSKNVEAKIANEQTIDASNVEDNKEVISDNNTVTEDSRSVVEINHTLDIARVDAIKALQEVPSSTAAILEDNVVITIQPEITNDEQNRIAIPVSTVGWISTTDSHFIPMSGLDFLLNVTKLNIQQTIELNDLMSSMDSENRYILKVTNGETIYVAAESSNSFQRLFFGTGRAFTMTMLDVTRQETLIMSRKIASTSWWFPCRQQEMFVSNVQSYIGRIEQQWSLFVPLFLVRDRDDKVIYLIQGPDDIKICYFGSKLEFKIMHGDTMEEQGTIKHDWESQIVNYSITIDFPPTENNTKHKALLIAAAFLLEYTYFEKTKKRKCFSCTCL